MMSSQNAQQLVKEKRRELPIVSEYQFIIIPLYFIIVLYSYEGIVYYRSKQFLAFQNYFLVSEIPTSNAWNEERTHCFAWLE